MYMTWANSVGDRSRMCKSTGYAHIDWLRGCLVFKKPSFITPHSIFITHHLSLKIPQLPKVACLTIVSNFDNSKNFTFLWDPRIDLVQLLLLISFFLFFFPSTPNTQTHRNKWKGIKKKKNLVWKEKRRRRRRRPTRFDYLHVVGLSNMCVFSKMPS